MTPASDHSVGESPTSILEDTTHAPVETLYANKNGVEPDKKQEDNNDRDLRASHSESC